jgi:hypothetical protein
MQRWGPHKNLNKEIFLTPVYCSNRMVISWFDPTYTGILLMIIANSLHFIKSIQVYLDLPTMFR